MKVQGCHEFTEDPANRVLTAKHVCIALVGIHEPFGAGHLVGIADESHWQRDVASEFGGGPFGQPPVPC